MLFDEHIGTVHDVIPLRTPVMLPSHWNALEAATHRTERTDLPQQRQVRWACDGLWAGDHSHKQRPTRLSILTESYTTPLPRCKTFLHESLQIHVVLWNPRTPNVGDRPDVVELDVRPPNYNRFGQRSLVFQPIWLPDWGSSKARPLPIIELPCQRELPPIITERTWPPIRQDVT